MCISEIGADDEDVDSDEEADGQVISWNFYEIDFTIFSLLHNLHFPYLKVTTKRKDSMASDTSEAGDKKLQNQFSFVERATQTMNNALKVSAFLTEKFSIKSKTRKINDKKF